MSAINDALAQLKIILAAVDASPQDAPTGAYVYPREWQAINTALEGGKLPLFTVGQVINKPYPWRRKAFGRGIHGWEAYIKLYLKIGLHSKHADIAAAADKMTEWPQAVATALYAKQTLNGTAHTIGQSPSQGSAGLFTYRIVHMDWGTSTYFGIIFTLPIYQTHAQPMVS